MARTATRMDSPIDQVVVVALEDPVVDERAQDQRVDGADDRVEDDDRQEDGQDLLVGDGEGEHPPGRALLDPVLQDGPVLAQGAHAAPRHHLARRPWRGLAYSWLQPNVGGSPSRRDLGERQANN